MGGTGKTPHVEYLIRLIKKDYKVATLSRGYGRKEYGFKIGDETSTALSIGDEPLQYFRKYGQEITVAVEANRVMGVMDLCREKPETQCVLLDDAYQHRAILPGLNILLTEKEKPYSQDWILPVGNLRECRLGRKRADIVILTKCSNFESISKDIWRKKLKLSIRQQLFLSSIKYGNPIGLGNGESVEISDKKVILVTGIANPDPLVIHIKSQAALIHHFRFGDHYRFKPSDLEAIHNIFDKFAADQPILLTTEKDAMRLLAPEFRSQLQDKPWYYQPIEVMLDDPEAFNTTILNYVKENH